MPDPNRIFLPFDQGLLDVVSGAICIRPQPDLPPDLPDLICEQGFKPFADQLSNRGFTVVPQASGTFPLALVCLTRSRAENMANIARACRMAPMVVVSGDKTDGIDATLKAVKHRTDIIGSLSKSHGKVFWFDRFDAPDWLAAGQMAKTTDGFMTCPGMFSADGIDKGSALLLDHLPKPFKGKVADLGAGWGFLSARLLTTSPDITQLDLFEAEHLALEAAKLNVTDPRANFIWSDVSTLDKDRSYDTVIMNPPFHQSRSADPQIGIDFILAAARLMKPNAELYMVANRQLPYEQALDITFKHWQILHQDGVYKVILAKRPKG